MWNIKESKYRGKGHSKIALQLLCDEARKKALKNYMIVLK